MKVTRDNVYKAIDGERDYQEQRWERPAHNHTNTEYLVYIDYYVKQAFAAVSTQDGEGATLPALRKIAALAVAAMEENGVEHRHDPRYHDYEETIEDGFGGAWAKRCPMCNEMKMQVVRPGKVQCENCG